MKYDLAVICSHHGSSQSLCQQLYKADHTEVTVEVSKQAANPPGDDTITTTSHFSSSPVINADVADSAITTVRSGVSEGMLLDHFRQESVHSPYCEFSVSDLHTPIGVSYSINLKSNSKSDSSGEDSALGSPNDIVLTQHIWKCANNERANDFAELGDSCFELPHFHGNLHSNEESGEICLCHRKVCDDDQEKNSHHELSFSNKKHLACSYFPHGCLKEGKALSRGYKSPVDNGLVADIAERGRGCEGETGRHVMVEKYRDQRKRRETTGDSGLDENDIFSCCENYS